jgi:hypothetical protein
MDRIILLSFEVTLLAVAQLAPLISRVLRAKAASAGSGSWSECCLLRSDFAIKKELELFDLSRKVLLPTR